MKFNADAPIYLQIVSEIKRRIVSGEWVGGSKTPTVRDLALEMGVNPNTVQKAVAMLEGENLLRAERTSGRYVTADSEAVEKAKTEMTAAEIEAFMSAMRGMGYRNGEISELFTQHIKKEGSDQV